MPKLPPNRRGRKALEERKLRICVYAIAKNEEKFVERFCRSAKDADFILIADTGSEDETAKKGMECGARVLRISISPWRFDHARNAALALVPPEIDICISLDLDEVLEPGWRDEIERIWRPGTTRMRYLYDWGQGVRFRYEKIHARNGYYWHHPCHEALRPDGRINEVWAETDSLLVRHLPDPNKSRGQYIDLLHLSVQEDPACPRNAFYYGRELFFHARWTEAIEALRAYLLMPSATWACERAYAMRLLLQCHEEIGDLVQAEAWGQRAAAEDPSSRGPLCALAAFYYRRAEWPLSYAYSKRTLSIKNRVLVYTEDPEAWGSMPHDIASIAAWRMGMRDEAVEQCKLAIAINPKESRLQVNLEWFEGKRTE